ncbi:DUF3348 family protein [Hydrogenophaga sp.]|uniref:DUF3348 family protein n=1 Tax=Hydrogenophaga sp. TaxID=1904254 RepID=UPI00261F5130|nr:DUF3348 family protein [Hydrogenophaga sp.]MCW5652635.1 DUF3348 family protein [Hydrogenophaga sp.]
MPRQSNRPDLIRLLAEPGADADAHTTEEVAQRLSEWLGVPDAIRLHAAHQTRAAAAPARRRASAPQPADEACRRLRATLAQAIAGQNPLRATGTSADDADGAYALLHQRHLELQRQMELRVDALRDHLRQTLSQTSPPLARLALLDTLLNEALGVREQRLFGALPQLLERRFALRQQQARQTDDGPPREGWLADFVKEWQAVLLAELDARLQPVVGLVEALRNHTGTHA